VESINEYHASDMHGDEAGFSPARLWCSSQRLDQALEGRGHLRAVLVTAMGAITDHPWVDMFHSNAALYSEHSYQQEVVLLWVFEPN
jgi:hypothetical protein